MSYHYDNKVLFSVEKVKNGYIVRFNGDEQGMAGSTYIAGSFERARAIVNDVIPEHMDRVSKSLDSVKEATSEY